VVDAVRAADPSLILSRAATLASQFDAPRLETRIFGGLIGVFAAVALILSIIGIYGVVAFGVARRTRELGIRIALGGTSRDVMRVVVLGGLRFVGIGIGIGLLLAVALGRVLKLFLFGVSPLDPVAYVAVALLFGAVAIVSCYLPARRVLRIDPLIALRSD
jgi:putative ABC transport system permease protein